MFPGDENVEVGNEAENEEVGNEAENEEVENEAESEAVENEVENEGVQNEAGNEEVELEEAENKIPNYYYGRNRYKWSSCPAISNRGRRPQENIVLHLPGLRPRASGLGNCADPITVWELLFTDQICEQILQWTNYKIAQQRAKYKSNSPTLNDIDKIELYALFGLLAFTSLFKSNNENLDTLFATNGSGREIIRCIMSKERCAFLLACLRFDNPEDRIMRQIQDASAAISNIFNIFVQNCQACYTIGTSACIDEMLIGFRGRCKI